MVAVACDVWMEVQRHLTTICALHFKKLLVTIPTVSRMLLCFKCDNHTFSSYQSNSNNIILPGALARDSG